jgi:acetyl esterase/lipase
MPSRSWCARVALSLLAGVSALFVSPSVETARAARAPATVQVERDVPYRVVGGVQLALDAYLPVAAGDAPPRPAIVLVHDGGWQGGDRSSMAAQANGLAAAGFAAFAVDYRLAPRWPYPAAVDDVEAAVRWLRDPAQVAKYHVDPRRIGAFGASAGGNLAAMLGVLGSGSLDQGARVAAVVSWSGPMLLSEHAVRSIPGVSGSAVTTYLGCRPAKCPAKARAASPALHVDSGDSPMLLANSTRELVPARQARRMDALLAIVGVPHELVLVRGELHARELQGAAWGRTLRFLREHVGGGQSGASGAS